MKKEYKHLLFDLDNTFWSVDANQQCAIQELYDRYSMADYFSDFATFFATFLEINGQLWLDYRDGRASREQLRNDRFVQLLGRGGVSDTDLAMEMSNEYLRITPLFTNLIDGSIEILEYLQSKGYPMSLVTNGFNEVQFLKVEKSGMSGFFTEIITSEFAGCNKPAVGIFEYAIQRAGVDKDSILMIGDDPHNDVFGATQAGLDSVLLNIDGREHPYSPTHEIRSLWELKNIL